MPAPLVEALDANPDDRLLLVHARGLGMTHSGNTAIREAFSRGAATSASLMLPCPWAREAAAEHRGQDIGIMFTLTAPFPTFRWGPLIPSPSLIDGNGGFPSSTSEVWDHADLDEVRRECRTQLERAIIWGFDISFISSYRGVLQDRPEFFDIALDIAVEYQLPMSLSSPEDQRRIGFPFHELAAAEGVWCADRQIDSRELDPEHWLDSLDAQLQPGMNELLITPAQDTAEQRAVDPDHAAAAVRDDIRCSDGTILEAFTRKGIRPVTFRQLRDAQRVAAATGS